jgi:hypothetical protein
MEDNGNGGLRGGFCVCEGIAKAWLLSSVVDIMQLSARGRLASLVLR